jgi:hypothetical protein
MTPEGAMSFTRRFGREVLPPLLRGDRLPKHLCLRSGDAPNVPPGSQSAAQTAP